MAANKIIREKRTEALAKEIHENFLDKALALTQELKKFHEEIQLLKLEQSELANEIKQTIDEMENFQDEMKFRRHRLRRKVCLICKSCENVNQ